MWFVSSRASRRTETARRPGTFRPRLHMLEDRCQPSTGVLDPTFGVGGQVAGTVTPNAVLVQPWDNKIVVAGYTQGTGGSVMTLARYNAGGSPDTTFDGDGKLVSNVAGSTGAAALYTQAGTHFGKIVEASGGTVARFTATAGIDTTFGTQGKATLPWSGRIGSVVVQSDGKVVVSGVVDSPTKTFNVTRLNANGSVDNSFATKGTWQITLPGIGPLYPVQSTYGYVTMQPDGKLLVSHPYAYLSPGYGWYVRRLTASGAPDATFAATFTAFGSAYNGPNGAALPRGLAIYPATDAANAGKVLTVGYTFAVSGGPSGGATVLARYNANGNLDTSFGVGGKVITPAGGTVSGVAIQADGQAIVVGETMQRYTTTGTLDATFGSGGFVNTAYAAVAIQPDGRIDVASSAVVARYLASQPQIGSFTADPNPVSSGGSATLTASNITNGNPNATITQLRFYYVDGSGNQQVLGYGTQSSPGVWTLTFTVGLMPGSYTVFAEAEDSYGVVSDPAALTLHVV